MDLLAYVPIPVILFGVYYYYFVSQKIKIYGKNPEQLKFLKGLKILNEKYYPTPLFINGTVQTIQGVPKRSAKRILYEREIFTLADGGEVALDYKLNEGSGRNTLAIVLPGLVSGSQTTYVRTLVMACEDAGVSVAVINYRGLAGMPLKTCRGFCASRCDDLAEVLKHIGEKFPEARKIGIGASLGGIILSQFLIQHPLEAGKLLECVVLVSTVWNMHITNRHIERPIIKQLLNYPLASGATYFLQKHKHVLEPRWNIGDIVKRSKTLKEVDANFTGPQFGYKNVEDYYDAASLTNKIHLYPIPVYALNAADDPLSPWEGIPIDEAEAARSKLVLLITARGGHLGFLEGLFPSKRRLHFVDRFVKDFLIAFQKESPGNIKT